MKLIATYTARSLEEIAAHFDETASALVARLEDVRTQSKKDELTIEANTWSRAATILRATKIVP